MSILSIIGQSSRKDHGKELAEASPRALLLLLESLALNAVNIDPVSKGKFQLAIRSLAAKIEIANTAEELMLLMGQVSQTIQTFAATTEHYAQAQRHEIQGMVDTLATTLVNVSRSSGQAAQNLREVERRLMAATLLFDIRELRAELKQSAALIQEESLRQARDYEVFRESANSAQSVKVPAAQTHRRVDEVTGLPSLREAESEIHALAPDAQIYPAVFFLEHLNTINNRYGYRAGDQVLIQFSQFLAMYMKPNDKLYRWRGPAFMALLSRNTSADSVRSDLKRFASHKMEYMLEVDNRKVLMKISSICALIPATPGEQPDGIVRRIDAFVTDQTSRSVG